MWPSSVGIASCLPNRRGTQKEWFTWKSGTPASSLRAAARGHERQLDRRVLGDHQHVRGMIGGLAVGRRHVLVGVLEPPPPLVALHGDLHRAGRGRRAPRSSRRWAPSRSRAPRRGRSSSRSRGGVFPWVWAGIRSRPLRWRNRSEIRMNPPSTNTNTPAATQRIGTSRSFCCWATGPAGSHVSWGPPFEQAESSRPAAARPNAQISFLRTPPLPPRRYPSDRSRARARATGRTLPSAPPRTAAGASRGVGVQPRDP